MSLRKPFCWLTLVSALLLLSGCELKRRVFLYNNTDAPLTVRYDQAGKIVRVAPHTAADVTAAFSMSPEIVQGQHTYRYFLPMTPIPADYQSGNGLELQSRFDFASDHRIYILPTGTVPSPQHPSQPVGFPLSPG